MMRKPLVNQVTASLSPYPMEALRAVKESLHKQGKAVYDFGTGDPTIPTWEKIRETLINHLSPISQYPSVNGTEKLRAAQDDYLARRFGLKKSPDWLSIPTSGSKEAIFHVMLSIVERGASKSLLVYPDPGYPVYRASAIFTGAIPYPVLLTKENGFLLEPWLLPQAVQEKIAALWINYPANPTGATCDHNYLEQVINWCHKHDVVLLSDDCYNDIYRSESPPPPSPISLTQDRVISFMSLSKRSGMTGYRCGMMVGDSKLLAPHLRARANFGVGQPTFIQEAATIAWLDDAHVELRRKLFDQRVMEAFPRLQKWGFIEHMPQGGFYMWCKVPDSFKHDDISFVKYLAEHSGVIASPSTWLGEMSKGYFRLALVPDIKEMHAAFDALDHVMEKL